MSAKIILGILIASSVTVGCGTEDLFRVQLAANEDLLDNNAVVSIASNKYMFEKVVVVGDLDGDGIDDAMAQPSFNAPENDDDLIPQGVVYILYGGAAVAGQHTLEDLPSLGELGPAMPGSVLPAIVPVGDVDGDGLADVLILDDVCTGGSNAGAHNGAYLIYGSRQRLTGATHASDAGAFLRDSSDSSVCSAFALEGRLGDLDGDGKADFAIALPSEIDAPDPSHAYLFYGRGTRLSGTVDIVAGADADLVFPDPGFNHLVGVGDVDGDGHADWFVAGLPSPSATVVDLRLIHGDARRLAGSVALADLPQTQFTGDIGGFGNLYGYTPPVSGLGDLDGDGVADFAVFGIASMPEEMSVRPSTQRVFYGRRGGFPAQVAVTDADATLVASTTSLNAAAPVATADLDGDGILDLLMTDATRHDQDGALFVLRGNGTRLSGNIDAAAAGNTAVGNRQRLGAARRRAARRDRSRPARRDGPDDRHIGSRRRAGRQTPRAGVVRPRRRRRGRLPPDPERIARRQRRARRGHLWRHGARPG